MSPILTARAGPSWCRRTLPSVSTVTLGLVEALSRHREPPCRGRRRYRAQDCPVWSRADRPVLALLGGVRLGAGRAGAGRIEGVLSLKHGPHLPVAVDHEGNAACVPCFVPDAVGFRNGSV